MAWDDAELLSGRAGSFLTFNVYVLELLHVYDHEELVRRRQMRSWVHVCHRCICIVILGSLYPRFGVGIYTSGTSSK